METNEQLVILERLLKEKENTLKLRQELLDDIQVELNLVKNKIKYLKGGLSD
tara:strand:- start:892 stop:1047 length:156 start_codon:yes stop_codon:yes gene_type:complete